MQGNVLHRELERLEASLRTLADTVVAFTKGAVEAVRRRDAQAADEVIAGDDAVDRMEVDFEEDCLKILALYQPVAVDLRLVIAMLKMNNDLERVADLAVSLARHAKALPKASGAAIPFDFEIMAERTTMMLEDAIEALFGRDAALAESVRGADDLVDDINREMYDRVAREIRKDPARVDTLIHGIGVSRCLERIADLATNVAEDVIYFVEGRIVRHAEARRIESASSKLESAPKK